MRVILTILTATILLTSCEKQSEQLEKFMFDSKQITSRTVHRYKRSDRGDILNDYSVTYYMRAGLPLDSSTSNLQYTYNQRGKVESIFDHSGSSRQLKVYNENNSLIAESTMNQFGDTTYMSKIDIKDGNEVRRVVRILTNKFPENLKDLTAIDFRNYDTLFYITEMTYSDGFVRKIISKDKHGVVTEESLHVYDGTKHITTLTYVFLGGEKYLSETTEYLSNNNDSPDFVTIGALGDTVGFRRTIFQDDMKVVVNYFGEVSTKIISYFDKKEKRIGMVEINYPDRIRRVSSYQYDDNGNVLEELNYQERLVSSK